MIPFQLQVVFIQNIINKTVDRFRLTCYDEFVLVDKLLTKKTNKRKK